LNVSLDALDSARFREITRGGDVKRTLSGIEAAKAAGFENIKINCVVKESSEEKDAREVAKYAERNGFQVRFIRLMNMEKGTFWAVEGGDGGRCEICNRLRLSSDGRVFPCLFNDLSFPVRELGAETALRLAIERKPESGHKSVQNRFYSLGG